MTRAEDRRHARQDRADADFLARFPKPEPPEEDREVNIWACSDCGFPTIARHVHAGVTPMMLACRALADEFDSEGFPLTDGSPLPTCGGMAVSLGYVLPPADKVPTLIAEQLERPPWEWYRPDTLAELRSLSPEAAEHVRKGGLVLRKNPGGISLREQLAEDPEAIEAASLFSRIVRKFRTTGT